MIKPRKKVLTDKPQKANLLIDIQAKLDAGKGAGYERWAKVFNLKQMAQTMNYLREHGLLDYAELTEKTAAATAQFNTLSAQIIPPRRCVNRSGQSAPPTAKAAAQSSPAARSARAAEQRPNDV